MKKHLFIIFSAIAMFVANFSHGKAMDENKDLLANKPYIQELHEPILGMIFDYLTDSLDHQNARKVCKQWKKLTPTHEMILHANLIGEPELSFLKGKLEKSQIRWIEIQGYSYNNYQKILSIVIEKLGGNLKGLYLQNNDFDFERETDYISSFNLSKIVKLDFKQISKLKALELVGFTSLKSEIGYSIIKDLKKLKVYHVQNYTYHYPDLIAWMSDHQRFHESIYGLSLEYLEISPERDTFGMFMKNKHLFKVKGLYIKSITDLNKCEDSQHSKAIQHLADFLKSDILKQLCTLCIDENVSGYIFNEFSSFLTLESFQKAYPNLKVFILRKAVGDLTQTYQRQAKQMWLDILPDIPHEWLDQ